jgi:hypothetical protein
MDQPQVDVPEPERIEALVEGFPLTTCATLRELRRHEDLLARDAALSHCLPDFSFVAVHRRGVDVPVTHLERAEDRGGGTAPAGLPRAQSEDRHLRSGCQVDSRVGDQVLVVHGYARRATWRIASQCRRTRGSSRRLIRFRISRYR